MTKWLDQYADVLPYGLHGTPFETVWEAVQLVAAGVWNVDPSVYRAGIAWGWYALHKPDALLGQRELVEAALISEQAPMVRASQTTAELVRYLTAWREYTPTFGRLTALYGYLGAQVEVRPVTDTESQAIAPMEGVPGAFYVRIVGVDWTRPLSLADAYEFAIRATPLGARPVPYYAFESETEVYIGAVSIGAVYHIGAAEPAAIPVIPVVGESGWMTDDVSETFAAPRGEFDMSALELAYGGGDQLWMNEATEVRGYLRSSAYQGSNRALDADTSYYLYPEGGDTTIDGDAQGVYELRGAYTAANVAVSITGATLSVSGGKLRLTWGPTQASVCYIIYRRII